MQVSFVCPEDVHFEELQDKLVRRSGVKAVARIATKSKAIEAFVACESEAALEETKKYLAELNIKVAGDAEKEKPKEKKAQPTKKKPQNEAAKFFTYSEPPQQQGSSNGRARGGRGGRGGRGSRGGAEGGENQQRQQRHNGHRGGRGGHFMRRQPYQWIQGFVAVLDNVPFSTTNEQLANIFAPCGQIYDINRLENMAMVYFEQQDAVQQAICTLNGKKIKENVITVSNGGSVRVPVPVFN